MADGVVGRCGACGEELAPGAGFCSTCGAAQARATPAAPGKPLDAPGAPAMLGAIGAGLLVLGSFLPWVTISAPFIGSISKSGMDGGDGWITVIAGAVAGVFVYRNWGRVAPALRNALLACGIVATLLTVYEFVDIGSTKSDLESETDDDDLFGADAGDLVDISYGFGLFVLVAGSAATVAGGVLTRQRLQGPTPPA